MGKIRRGKWKNMHLFNIGTHQSFTLFLNVLLVMNQHEICFVRQYSHSYVFGFSYYHGHGMCIAQIFQWKQTRYFLFSKLMVNSFQKERRKVRLVPEIWTANLLSGKQWCIPLDHAAPRHEPFLYFEFQTTSFQIY